MIFIEPTVAFVRRTRPLPPPVLDTMTARQIMARSMVGQAEQQFGSDDPGDLILEILRFEGDLPVRITDVVNRVAAWTPIPSRREREKVKIMTFRRIGQMVRTGVLRRVSRNYVLIEPLRKAHQEQAPCPDPIELPEPRL
ncbi:MAG: hypothetical protein AB9869_38455 [Verrucomicrobiia bacterium]